MARFYFFNSTVLLATTLLLSQHVIAGQTTVVIDAPVDSVKPLVDIVTHRVPHRRCSKERVRVIQGGPSERRFVPIAVGGLVGGVIGRVAGQNSSQRGLITSAGAIVGASVAGDRVRSNRHNQVRYRIEEVCEVEFELREEERIIGYRVSYRIGEKRFVTRTETAPGSTLPVRVVLNPLL